MRPLLAITMGDPAGIGPEVCVKALSLAGVHEGIRPFVIGNRSSLEVAIKEAGVDSKIRVITDLTLVQPEPGVIDVLEPTEFDCSSIKVGEVSAACGHEAVKYFEHAVRLAQKGLIQGVVTCPINKEAVHAAGYHGDIGHQEILARMTKSSLTATMLMTPGLKVAHLSTHKSLGEAVTYVRKDVLIDKLRLTSESLSQWSGGKPKIAVSALNPHGGEGGMLGREEIDEIAPAVIEMQRLGYDVVGPYPADSVFYRAIAGEFDAVMALYHDQGHIAIKVHNFEDSITATMGIPFVRTSVDHGTAFDIAGKNMADASGLGRALEAAVQMITGTMPLASK
ncbi:MAG: 4-hydroxythreonine-4-phosphate dehydrogenase [Candidatus Azotimanducaceae bacterium]|jgi:4-hydroxythreonine-4-phosphate dehydrogenase